MSRVRRAAHIVLVVCLTVAAATCSGDNVTRPDTGTPALATTGTPATITINRQPPTSALDQEVWGPALQPIILVKDAGGVALSGVVVTVQVASGTGALQGALSATTRTNGTAGFTDLGIAGTGQQTLRFTAGAVSKVSKTITINPLPPEAASGKWDPPVDWAIVPLHIHLLPTGKVLAWGKYEPDGTMAMPRLWDPASGPPINAPMARTGLDTMLFCSGHALMPDGRLMVSGGHKADDRGLDVTNVFDPVSETWAPGLPKMAKGRWYPSVTTLWDGRMITVAGRDSASNVVVAPEIWENNRWVQLTGSTLILPYYPRDFVAPNGKLFYAGERVTSRWFNPDAVTSKGRGAWSWSSSLNHVWQFNRDYGSAVMYDTGKILYAGGGGYLQWGSPDPKAAAPTETAEIIDINTNVASPHWTGTDPMHFPRRHLNATVLPNGQVLVTGGTSAGGFNTLSGAVHAAEVWDTSGHWTVLASNTIDRAYHSVSLLLPDGTVLHGGSGDAAVPGSPDLYPRQTNSEIFRPPYLFKGARPTITSLSQSSVGYSQTFTVNTPNGLQITEVRWIRLGSVTHAFDANQRANTLKFTKTSTNVKVTAPANGKLAPPGHYLVFILNRNGVPSVGKFIKVQ
jgi:galactose oxidase-like protein